VTPPMRGHGSITTPLALPYRHTQVNLTADGGEHMLKRTPSSG